MHPQPFTSSGHLCLELELLESCCVPLPGAELLESSSPRRSESPARGRLTTSTASFPIHLRFTAQEQEQNPPPLRDQEQGHRLAPPPARARRRRGPSAPGGGCGAGLGRPPLPPGARRRPLPPWDGQVPGTAGAAAPPLQFHTPSRPSGAKARHPLQIETPAGRARAAWGPLSGGDSARPRTRAPLTLQQICGAARAKRVLAQPAQHAPPAGTLGPSVTLRGPPWVSRAPPSPGSAEAAALDAAKSRSGHHSSALPWARHPTPSATPATARGSSSAHGPAWPPCPGRTPEPGVTSPERRAASWGHPADNRRCSCLLAPPLPPRPAMIGCRAPGPRPSAARSFRNPLETGRCLDSGLLLIRSGASAVGSASWHSAKGDSQKGD